ncbi:hypothetical protein B0H13DRAFT_2007169 [Mycena leptocephala]|nr:hypothetical protein B0H13DRAFT_2007169 [Mycena leptocephala]
MSQPTAVAMPQPTYAYDKPLGGTPPPPNGYTQHPASDVPHGYNQYPTATPESNDYPAGAKPESAGREIARTPSPTSSEIDLLNGVKKPKSLGTKLKFAAALVLVVAVIVVIEAFHDQIVNGLKPITRWLHGARGGWLIPIVVMIALSFPPLFGHEVVAMLCGLVWGLGQGFGIVAAGTLLGEIITYFFFKYCCGARGKRLELTNIQYGTLAHIVREGGLVIPIIIRYSSFPAHCNFTTAVFSTCGMSFWVFLVAAVVSLPKQLVLVYVGVALASDESKSKTIQRSVIGVTIVVTVVAMLYIRRLMKQARPAVVYARRKSRQAKLQGSPEV